MNFRSFIGVTPALLAIIGFAQAPASAQNLVTNPGFETGDFTGWTTTPAASGSDFHVFTLAHTGFYAAGFGAAGGIDDSISQTLPTIAGEQYAISFFLDANAGVGNEFHAAFGSDTLLEINNTSNHTFPYTQYSFTDVATGPSTVLTFAKRTPLGFFYLDDISVTDAGPAAVPEASSMVSLGLFLTLGLSGLALSTRKVRTG